LRSVGGARTGQLGSQKNNSTTLVDLLTPASTIPLVDSLDVAAVDRFLEYLPPNLLFLAREAKAAAVSEDDLPTDDVADAVLSLDEKKDLLRRVLRSPQFSQSLSSLTTALRDGGLPMISEALQIPVQNGGFMRRGGVPLGGGNAVDAFLKGVKDHVDKHDKNA
jgi:26S proteasome regulatory subunit N13